MRLSGTQFQQLQKALLSAFPSQSNLKQMVYFQLNENLDAIVGGSNMNEVAFNLIQWAESQGRTPDLIRGALESNSGNPALQAFAANFGGDGSAGNVADGLHGGKAGGNQADGDQVGGDKVGGDKVGGDKFSVGDISNATGVAMGDGAQVNINHHYYTNPAADQPSSGSQPTANQEPATNQAPEVFVSYAWNDDSEAIVDQLDAAFQAKGITILRDKRNVDYKDRIRDFMRRLGQGNCIIVVIGKKYLESENCMFELLEIANHGEFTDRIFPVILDDADIYDPLKRLQYIKYWEDKTRELDQAIRSVSSANLQGFRESIDLYTEIRGAISGLTDTLADMNALTPEMHRNSEFTELIEAVVNKLDGR